MPFTGDHQAELKLRHDIIEAVRSAADLHDALVATSALLRPLIQHSGMALAMRAGDEWQPRAGIGVDTLIGTRRVDYMGPEHQHMMSGQKTDTYVHVIADCPPDAPCQILANRAAVAHTILRDSSDEPIGVVAISFDDTPPPDIVHADAFENVMSVAGSVLARKLLDDPASDELLAAFDRLSPDVRLPFVHLMEAVSTIREQSEAALIMADAGLGRVGVEVGIKISHDGQRVDLYLMTDRPTQTGGRPSRP